MVLTGRVFPKTHSATTGKASRRGQRKEITLIQKKLERGACAAGSRVDDSQRAQFLTV
jgi:hypothetical protein